MTGADEWLAELASGSGPAVVLAVALLLGLRHASDPDHLAAVSTLIAADPAVGARRAARLGLAWGGGHALSLAVFGVPRTRTARRRGAPPPARARLAGARPRARAGGAARAHAVAGLRHRRRARLRRLGGVGVLLLAAIPGQSEAVAALLVLALGTAVSMAVLSSAFGFAITRGPVLTRMPAFAPAMGALTLAFGCWYTLAAAGAVGA